MPNEIITTCSDDDLRAGVTFVAPEGARNVRVSLEPFFVTVKNQWIDHVNDHETLWWRVTTRYEIEARK